MESSAKTEKQFSAIQAGVPRFDHRGFLGDKRELYKLNQIDRSREDLGLD